MKTLVIPDVHQSIERVKEILSVEDFDEVVFLGDWVDSHFNPPAVSGFRETCSYLRHLLVEHPLRNKFVFLLGNHDLQYIHLNNKASTTSVVAERAYYCSGFSKSKAREWRRVFFDEGLRDSLFLDKFRVCHLSQGWLFSHAGISESHIPYGEGLQEFIGGSCREAWTFFRQLNHPRNYLLSDVGQVRGGNARIGGPLWMDWREEFTSSSHIGKQIVGHTTLDEPGVKGEGTEESWNLDVAGCYGVVEDGKLSLNRG
jgi:hypothetical protein